jgi:hypothetical protein
MGHVEYLGEMRDACKIFVGEHEANKPLGGCTSK